MKHYWTNPWRFFWKSLKVWRNFKIFLVGNLEETHREMQRGILEGILKHSWRNSSQDLKRRSQRNFCRIVRKTSGDSPVKILGFEWDFCDSLWIYVIRRSNWYITAWVISKKLLVWISPKGTSLDFPQVSQKKKTFGMDCKPRKVLRAGTF